MTFKTTENWYLFKKLWILSTAIPQEFEGKAGTIRLALPHGGG
jgi:hypothetical protein